MAGTSGAKLDLTEFVQYFLIGARTWADCRRVVESHPEFVTDEAYRAMEDVSAFAPEHAQPLMERRLSVFQQCCTLGVKQAFQQVSDG